jgi:hypothetical protein
LTSGGDVRVTVDAGEIRLVLPVSPESQA